MWKEKTSWSHSKIQASACWGLGREDYVERLPEELKRTVFQTMRLDDLHSALISDPIIIQFGRVLMNQLGPGRSNYVSQTMRQLARLKIQLNTLVNGKKMEYYISPKYFDLIERRFMNWLVFT